MSDKRRSHSVKSNKSHCDDETGEHGSHRRHGSCKKDWRRSSDWSRDRRKSSVKSSFKRSFSTRSRQGSESDEVKLSRQGSVSYVRRLSVTPSTDKQFDRQFSQTSTISDEGHHRTRRASVAPCEYHDDLKEGLESGLTWQLLMTTAVIVFGSSFQFGYNIGVLNQPSHLIKDFFRNSSGSDEPLSETTVILLWSVTNAVFIPGGMLGAFLGGLLADKWGRKKSILFSHIFVILGAILASSCVAANAKSLLIIARFLFGVNAGLGNCFAPMFLSEIVPFNLRGAFGTVHQLSVTMGILFASIFGLDTLLGTPTKWPFLMLLEVIPAITSLLILPFLPDTPRFLLLIKGERESAEKSLKFYRNRVDVSTDMEEMDTEAQESDGDKPETEKEVFTVKKLIQSRELRLPLMTACFLQVIQQLSGINAVFFYSNGIFANAGVAVDYIPYAVIGTNAVNVIMTVITVPMIEIAGRRPLLLYPMIAMVIDLVFLTISLNLQADYHWLSYISVICVIFYVICFAVGLGPIPMMIGAELFRQGPRPLAIAAAGVTNWVFTFLVAMCFEPLQAGMGNFTFLLFLVLMVVFVIFVYFKVPETKGKTFEEIAHVYAPGKDIEVEELVEDDAFAEIPEEEKLED